MVGLAIARVISTYAVFNSTSDEPAHIACGMEWLQWGTYTYEPQHPPLARAMIALGPYLAGIRPLNDSNRNVEGRAVSCGPAIWNEP